MAQALTQLQLDLSALYEEHDDALSLSDEYKDAGPGNAMYDNILSEMKSEEKTLQNLARLVREHTSAYLPTPCSRGRSPWLLAHSLTFGECAPTRWRRTS